MKKRLLIFILFIVIGTMLIGCSSVDVEQMMDQAESYIEEGKYEQAEKSFKKVLKKEPDNLNAKLGTANTNILLGNIEDALAMYEDILEEEPQCYEAYLGIADIYITQERYEEAVNMIANAKQIYSFIGSNVEDPVFEAPAPEPTEEPTEEPVVQINETSDMFDDYVKKALEPLMNSYGESFRHEEGYSTFRKIYETSSYGFSPELYKYLEHLIYRPQYDEYMRLGQYDEAVMFFRSKLANCMPEDQLGDASYNCYSKVYDVEVKGNFTLGSESALLGILTEGYSYGKDERFHSKIADYCRFLAEDRIMESAYFNVIPVLKEAYEVTEYEEIKAILFEYYINIIDLLEKNKATKIVIDVSTDAYEYTGDERFAQKLNKAADIGFNTKGTSNQWDSRYDGIVTFIKGEYDSKGNLINITLKFNNPEDKNIYYMDAVYEIYDDEHQFLANIHERNYKITWPGEAATINTSLSNSWEAKKFKLLKLILTPETGGIPLEY